MGRAKADQEKELNQGYGDISKNVCTNCISEPFLIHKITEYAVENREKIECDYCNDEDMAHKEEPVTVAPLQELMNYIMDGISFYYEDPVHNMPYDSQEGGYQCDTTETTAVLEDLSFTENFEIIENIAETIHNNDWVEKDYFIGSERQRYVWAWQRFCDEIMNTRRYVFLHSVDKKNGSADISPADFLFKLGDYTNKINIIKTISKKKKFFRVRVGEEKFTTAKELGAPPAKYATQSNRMSPAGISMFYGAFDKKTAKLETYDPSIEGDYILSIGIFKPVHKLRLLDLSTIPNSPSDFDAELQHLIYPSQFFKKFATDIAKPIQRDGREHIEYVPTQVITEFYRHIYGTKIKKEGKRKSNFFKNNPYFSIERRKEKKVKFKLKLPPRLMVLFTIALKIKMRRHLFYFVITTKPLIKINKFKNMIISMLKAHLKQC